jgi:predicted HTH domain antitoxin
MSLVISNELMQASGLSEEDFLLEIIILLFQKKKISIGKASKLAGLPLLKFQHELAVRQIPIHYDVEEFEVDLQTLLKAERL